LEVICVRLGGVPGREEEPWKGLRRDGLTYPDLVTLFQSCLEAKKVPNNYSIVYGISKNRESVLDISNPFDWSPELDAADFYGMNN